MYSIKSKCSFLAKTPISDQISLFFSHDRVNVNVCRLLSSSIYMLEKELSSGYKPKDVESNTYLKTPGHFPKCNSNKVFSMVLPPPNITGHLHLGHAINLTIQDVLARWHKLKGYDIMWVPGFDHAGIATQVVVEKQLLKMYNKTRLDVGREEFIKSIWNWKHQTSEQIKNQLQGMGTLLNWEKEMFTLDTSMFKAVNDAFIILFDEGLIYRDNALVNWCCQLQSALSDIEIETKEITEPTYINVPGYNKSVKFGIITEIAYKLCDSDEQITVATTRPETIYGDVAIAVSPNDSRYTHLKNAQAKHPFLDKTIPIIFDESVDPDFGTGAVKITPAHDHKDFEIAKRHKLPLVQIFDESGCMNDNCGKYSNMNRFEVRELIIDELKFLNLYRNTKNHPMAIPICSRTGDIIELLIKPQWFINCKDLAKSAVRDVETGLLEIEPKCFEQNWFNWLNNIRDWCISRQLWWGHQIPVYECYDNNNSDKKIFVAASNLQDAINKAKSKLGIGEEDLSISQDPDVLDTWFSSALFPFAVHGWPIKTEELKKYYPLNIMQTGHDILFFWVARMVMLGKKLTGVLPFRKILLHGIICDVHGRKMSKSLGNTIEPNDIINGVSLEDLQTRLKKHYNNGLFSDTEIKKSIEGQKKLYKNGIPECGIDALRYTLCSKNIKTHFINFDINECHTNKLFGNKIWQATRYTKLLVNLCRENEKFENMSLEKAQLSYMDLWILSKLAQMVTKVNTSLENSDFHIATSALKQFLYSELCDVYIETTKPFLKEFNLCSINSCYTLIACLNIALKNLSIFMPHLSEELLAALPKIDNIFGIDLEAFYPIDQLSQFHDPALESNVQTLLDIISTIRRIRLLHNISKKNVVKVILEMKLNSLDYNCIQPHLNVIETLIGCQNIEISEETPKYSIFDTVSAFCSVHIIPSEVIKISSIEVNKKRKLLKQITKLQETISKKGYREKAPIDIQNNNDNKLKVLFMELEKLETLLSNKVNVN